MHVHKKTPLLFIRQLPDRRFCSDKGFFHTLRTRRKKIQEKEKKEEKKKGRKGGEATKKAEKRKKTGKRKTENDKERNGIKPQALYNHAQGFLVTKKDPAKPDLFSI